ncbi:hypothetical protein [Nocardioides sp. NPDC006273]|uniref:hypothetical protein n=1 Tax=Nocardioides sp. NPDC006273 TaxID=3155598 RepID=UPI00339DCC6D
MSALATGWVVLAGLGGDWARLIAFLGLSVAGLALLAVAPHALMLRWVKRHRRSPISPWPTLAAVAATAIPFPATLLIISREPLMLFNVLIATLGVLLFVEIILILHLSERQESGRTQQRQPSR